MNMERIRLKKRFFSRKFFKRRQARGLTATHSVDTCISTPTQDMERQGLYGNLYDRSVERTTDQSTFQKMKETYWTTKQAVIKKLGKKEDEHVVASDSELDAKLEVFKSIQKSCMDLLRVLEKYQDRICNLSQEENAMGRFLKNQSSIDKTRAGKMMAAVGKSQSFSSQQRLALRQPLVRLYQEVETFRYRAISDTLMTINRMEGARTEYRGALLWMKDVSEELDPDTYKQLEKFRKVQAQVRKTKLRFDKLKIDVMQKVDLLAASRSNMFSHVLASYQSTLLHFWEKTARTMTAVAESFKGYQYYEFSMLKELQEPSKKLADETATRETPERDLDEWIKKEGDDEIDEDTYQRILAHSESKKYRSRLKREDNRKNITPDGSVRSSLIDFDGEDAEEATEIKEYKDDPDEEETSKTKDDDDDRLEIPSLPSLPSGAKPYPNFESHTTEKKDETKTPPAKEESSTSFIDFGDDEESPPSSKNGTGGDFEDFSGNLQKQPTTKKQAPKDLLSEEFVPDDTEKDDLELLNEILNAPSSGGDDFTKEWQAVFGSTPLTTNTSYTPVESDQPQTSPAYMPSHLLDLNTGMGMMNLGAGAAPSSKPTSTPSATQPKPKPAGKKKQQDMSAWFNLFADLDPLSNPDAVGKQEKNAADAL